ncbi:hypothetical protein P691DRAFT_793511 [Macrolepiota fuliginosa MF-IS2]|uniref:Uncharacterized protein n=1 Tax=Macrolepiota fuliginosa MF-IS2 TaxID=1400762 RepID=A0A9P5XKG9_9AGAR|nr:hypothetical protein P691DRAFT_793511 [Macrolepiota fuliginosa MF-IS2]
MAPFKRKFDEIDDSDSDEASFGKQILPVANLPDGFSSEPVDGMQYLFTVRRDAKALPHFTRVANPYETSVETAEPRTSKSIRQNPHTTLPSDKWRELTEARWRNLRKNFDQPTIAVSLSTSQQRKLMPDKKERDLWWAFLEGKPKSVWSCPPRESKKKNKGKQRQQYPHFAEGSMYAWDDQEREHGGSEEGEHHYEEIQTGYAVTQNDSEISIVARDEGEVENALKVGPQDSLPTPTGTPAPSDGVSHAAEAGPSVIVVQEQNQELLTAREPSPQLLKLIDERMALHLIMYFTHWINLHLREPDSPTYRPTNTHARWIFSLLLRIDDYISADDVNLLRNLARACLAFLKITFVGRMKGTPSGPSAGAPSVQVMDAKACWIIVSAIVGIWGQRDLWMDAEDLLAGIE